MRSCGYSTQDSINYNYLNNKLPSLQIKFFGTFLCRSHNLVFVWKRGQWNWRMKLSLNWIYWQATRRCEKVLILDDSKNVGNSGVNGSTSSAQSQNHYYPHMPQIIEQPKQPHQNGTAYNQTIPVGATLKYERLHRFNIRHSF